MMTNEWRAMDTAPRDGTVIEIKNCFGLLATYGLFRWTMGWWKAGRDNWLSVTKENTGIINGIEDRLKWRPYVGKPADYAGNDYNPDEADYCRIGVGVVRITGEDIHGEDNHARTLGMPDSWGRG